MLGGNLGSLLYGDVSVMVSLIFPVSDISMYAAYIKGREIVSLGRLDCRFHKQGELCQRVAERLYS